MDWLPTQLPPTQPNRPLQAPGSRSSPALPLTPHPNPSHLCDLQAVGTLQFKQGLLHEAGQETVHTAVVHVIQVVEAATQRELLIYLVIIVQLHFWSSASLNCVVLVWKLRSAHDLGASVGRNLKFSLMNSFNKTEAAISPCKLCFLRTALISE